MMQEPDSDFKKEITEIFKDKEFLYRNINDNKY